jgi:signal transduction histidine kinase
MAVVLWGILVLAITILLMNSRDRLEAAAKISTSNLARSMEGNISDNLTGIGIVLAGMEDSLLAMRKGDEGWRDAQEIMRIMQSRAAQTPLSRGLTLIDAAGKTVVATHLANPLIAHDLSDRDYFIYHRDNADTRLRISKPVQSKADRRWVIVISRRIQGIDGKFYGVLTASIDLADLAKRLDGFHLPNHDSLVIIDANGYILARRPNHDDNVGTQIPLSYIPSENFGHGQLTSPLDKRERFFAFEKSSTYDFVAVASIDIENTYAPWRKQIAIHLMIGAGGTFFIILLVFYLLRQLRRHEALLAELSSARNQAEEASRAKINFLAGVSHELRTPLNAILGFSEIVAKQHMGSHAQAKYIEYAQDIYDSAQHLLGLIDDLLDVSRIETGFFELRLKPVVLASLVEECFALLRGHISERNVVTISEVPDDFPKLFCDERAIRQVLLNIFSNAAKFTPIGGRILVSAAINDVGEVEILVSDTGPGIPAIEQERLLAPFTRGKSQDVREIEGTGLGLPISKKLVEAHGGRLNIENCDYGGAKIVIILPPSRILLSEVPKISAE